MKTIGVFTSGGDAPGMNACLRAVVRTARQFGMQVWGICRGYQGMIEGEFRTLNMRDVSNIIQLGGTILHSARSEAFRTPQGRQRAWENLKARGIEGLVAIGGDGTFTGAKAFLEEYPELRIVGAPGTIDNDLYGTDYTIGYDTAINTAMHAIDHIKDTANSHDRVFFVEVMGRDAGFIALASGIATGAEAVLIPESRTNIDALVELLRRNIAHKKWANIIVVAEGDDEGGAFEVARKVSTRLPQIEARVTVLGHVQRGGRPTCMERIRASRIGMECVRALKEGKSGIMVGIVHRDIAYTPFEQAIKHHQQINPTLLEIVRILS